MDVSISKKPLTLEGVQWSNANRCIIATPTRVFIVTPQHTMENEILKKREVSASIEPEVEIEAISLVEGLSQGFQFSHAIVALASDSSIRLLASPINPDALAWIQVAKHQFGTGVDHVVSISSCMVAGSDLECVSLVACGSVGGTVEVVRLVPKQQQEDADVEDLAEIESLVRISASTKLVAHVGWLTSERYFGPGTPALLLAACAVDGTASIWQLTRDATECREVATVGRCDWSAFTAHATGSGIAVLAKIGMAAIVDITPEGLYQTQHVDLGVSQTVACCVVDDWRERVYIGTHDFVWFVLAQKQGKWMRVPEEEGAFRDGLRTTIVRSFTTKFNMNQLFLRGMDMSPNGRYLSFIVDDQINWDLALDGYGITRIHNYQVASWNAENSKRALDRIVSGKYCGTLGYNLSDILDRCTAAGIGDLLEFMKQAYLSGDSEETKTRCLFVMNYIGCMLRDGQFAALVAEARNAALDLHVRRLFGYIEETTRSGSISMLTDDDRAYLDQVDWAVHQPPYADVAGQLPEISSIGKKAAGPPLLCPVCGKAILASPGSDQCNTCLAKRKHTGDNKSQPDAGLALGIRQQFPLCPVCEGVFYPAVA
ncbi:hypothetical protein GGF39_000608 [Coemansia sp. RSA 1721]|nr:hypothetical protein GGF39_000608 [Coemansia sp. RSA 1721]